MSGSGIRSSGTIAASRKRCIGVGDFKRIDVSPPQDHRHVYINMREADTIL